MEHASPSEAILFDNFDKGPCSPLRVHSDIMATLATTTFLDHLKSIYPARGSLTSEAVLANPWFLVAAVAFSSSNIPEAIPVVFDYALNDLKQAQSHDLTSETAFQERLGLARKLREALLQSGLLSGMPRVISSLIELNKVMPEELREKAILRDTKKNMAEYEANGRVLFESMYRETADSVQSLLDNAYPDLGWWSNTIGYGVTYGGTSLLSQVESSYAIVASLIAMDAPRQITWHLANAQHGGATLEETKAVRQIAIAVAEKAGVTWRTGVPEAV